MIRFSEEKTFSQEAVLELYRQVGWTNYTKTPEMLERAIANSLYVLGAFDGEQLVGLIRAVGDGVSILFIQDLLILPAYQRQGIGKTMMKRCLETFSACYQIHLLTEVSDKTHGFYTDLGFKTVDEISCCAYTYLR